MLRKLDVHGSSFHNALSACLYALPSNPIARFGLRELFGEAAKRANDLLVCFA
jgi:hypothetical protein